MKSGCATCRQLDAVRGDQHGRPGGAQSDLYVSNRRGRGDAHVATRAEEQAYLLGVRGEICKPCHEAEIRNVIAVPHREIRDEEVRNRIEFRSSESRPAVGGGAAIARGGARIDQHFGE